MRLTTKTRYGLRALCHVAHRGYASAQAIAETQCIPSRYLEEIIGELRRAGLVVGKRGPRGGYRLAVAPDEISLASVIDALATVSGDARTSQDEITDLVERAVDARLSATVDALSLADLLGEAQQQYRRSAVNYVI